MAGDNCCDETPVTGVNPFVGVHKMGVSSVALPNIPDPIPKEVEDSGELKEFFDSGKYVPYAGVSKSSGHGLLKFYQKLYTLSPTHGSVIEKLIKYCFSGAAVFERAKDPEYDIQDEIAALTAQESKMYLEALKNTIQFEDGILRFHQRILRNLKKFGDAFIEMSYAETEGVFRFYLRVLKNETVLYGNTKVGEARYVGISPKWDHTYLQKNPERKVFLFPVTSEEEGVSKTMFHLKTGENTWYGKPDSQMADVYKYREMQDALYVTREAANNYTGKIIADVEGVTEDDDKQAIAMGFRGFADRMKFNYTAGGEGNSMMVLSHPIGANPAAIKQIMPNTNENWYKTTGELNAEYILRAHCTTKRFMSFDQANGLSTNPFFDDYITNMAPVIGELRETVTNFTNKILSEIWAITGQSDMNQYSINFRSPIDKALELYTNSLGNANNSNGGSTL